MILYNIYYHLCITTMRTMPDTARTEKSREFEDSAGGEDRPFGRFLIGSNVAITGGLNDFCHGCDGWESPMVYIHSIGHDLKIP